MLLSLLLATMVPVQNNDTAEICGAGVLIHSELVLTAAHVVRDNDVTVLCSGKLINATTIAKDLTLDLALLELAESCPLSPSQILNKNPALGDNVDGAGCPKGRCGWLVFGRVIAYDIAPGPSGTMRTMLISDAPIWFGNSGGPLYNERKQLVGIASQLLRLDGPNGMHRFFAAYVPAESIWTWLQEISQ